MSVDGFITMPSFRPDGRLARLNHGGGSKLPKTIPGEPAKVQKQPDFFRVLMLAAHQKPDGSKKLDPEVGYTIPYGQGKLQKTQGAGQSHAQQQSSSGGDAGAGMSVPRPAPAAAPAVAAVGPKKRRTLLSGGGVLSQPYGSDTVLGG